MAQAPVVQFYSGGIVHWTCGTRKHIVVHVTPPPRLTIRHIVYVVDTSGSMAKARRHGYPSIETAKAFLERAIHAAATADYTQVAIVAFDSTATTIRGLGYVTDPQDREAAIAAIRDLRAAEDKVDGKCSNLTAGLEVAYTLLSGVNPADSRHIVVVTDGHCWVRANANARFVDVITHVVYASEDNGDLKDKIHYDSTTVTNVGLGFNDGKYLFKRLRVGYDVGAVVVTYTDAKRVITNKYYCGTVDGELRFNQHVPLDGTVKVEIQRRDIDAPYVTAIAVATSVNDPPPPLKQY